MTFLLCYAALSSILLQRNQEATLWVGGPLDERVDDDLLWELFVQAGPIASVHIPVDKVTGRHQGYGFVEFKSETDAEYALRVLNLVPLFGRPIKVRHASSDKSGRNARDVGANLFIGGLDVTVDESALQATFGAFGVIIDAKVMRDPDTGVSKGFGFVSFDSFEASDAAIEAMNGQHFGGRPIAVQYAFKKDSKHERHGCTAERLLAQQRKEATSTIQFKPHTMFASAPGVVTPAPGASTSSVPMIGQTAAQAPPLLPPTAIAPAATHPYPYPQPASAAPVYTPPPMLGPMGAVPRPPPLPTAPVMPGSMPMPPPMPGVMPGSMPMPGGMPMPGVMPGMMSMPPPMHGMMPGAMPIPPPMPGVMHYPMQQ